MQFMGISAALTSDLSRVEIGKSLPSLWRSCALNKQKIRTSGPTTTLVTILGEKDGTIDSFVWEPNVPGS